MSDLETLTLRYRRFSAERDWEKFHDPRSLILALMGEVGELAELYQWPGTQTEARPNPDSSLHQRSTEEISDVLLYLVRLADVLGIDLIKAANEKLNIAEKRFPVNDFLGRAPHKD